MLRISILFTLLLSLLTVSSVNAKSIKKAKIRVRIQADQSIIKVKGTDIERHFFTKESKRFFPGKREIRFNCKKFSDKAIEKRKVSLFAYIRSRTGLLTVGKQKYKGKILIAISENGKSCDVINETDLETYISSLLSKEMNGTWPLEALKAQAIAARTYAIYKIRLRQFLKKQGKKVIYDIENSEKHQVGGHYFDATYKTVDAALSTRGQILLTNKGKLTETFFHASCGGSTLLPHNVWSNSVDGYKSVKCPRCSSGNKNAWKANISNKRFLKFIKWIAKNNKIDSINIGDSEHFIIAPDKKNNRRLRVYFGTKVVLIKKTLFRKYFGRVAIKSNNFVADYDYNKITIHGNGHGHGVGMCQMGALHMAKMGKNYSEILQMYFPGHELKKIY